MSELKELVRQYVEIDNEIRATNEKLKPLRPKHKQLKASIIEAMAANEIDVIAINNDTEQLKLTTTVKPERPTKKDDVLDAMAEYMQNQSAAEQLYEHVFESGERVAHRFSRTKKRKRD